MPAYTTVFNPYINGAMEWLIKNFAYHTLPTQANMEWALVFQAPSRHSFGSSNSEVQLISGNTMRHPVASIQNPKKHSAGRFLGGRD